jgi:hypothetical protein
MMKKIKKPIMPQQGMRLTGGAEVGAPGTVTIDTGALDREMTEEEKIKAEEIRRRNEEFGKTYNPIPGQVQIDPVTAGWQEPPGPSSTEMFKEARDRYKGVDYGYNPYKQDTAGVFEGQDFDPYRQGAMAEADRQGAMERQGAYNDLLQGGPSSASDRMQLVSDFNRRKITGTLGAQSGANQREQQGLIQTGRQNIGRGMDVDAANSGAYNQMARSRAVAEDARRLNLYHGDREEALLDKKLRAAREISKMPDQKGFGSKILEMLKF